MKALLNSLKTVAQKIRDYFPSNLPQGMTAMKEFSDSLINTYKFPIDETSVRFTVAAMIVNLGPLTSRKAKRYFVLGIRAAVAKQLAGQVMYNIKDAQKEAAKAKPAEVTALHAVPSDGSK